MDYMDRSYICQGFLVKETDEIHGDPVSKHSVTYAEDGIEETEMRGFLHIANSCPTVKGNAVPCAAKLKIIIEENTLVRKNARIDPLFHRDATTSTFQGSSSSLKSNIYRNCEQQRIRSERKFRPRC